MISDGLNRAHQVHEPGAHWLATEATDQAAPDPEPLFLDSPSEHDESHDDPPPGPARADPASASPAVEIDAHGLQRAWQIVASSS